MQDLINDLVQTFSMDFNLGKNQTKNMMPFCRKAVETYVYQQLNENLMAIYKHKNQEIDEKFCERQKQLEDVYSKISDG